MIFKNDSEKTRLQGALIRNDDINDFCDAIRRESYPDYVIELEEENPDSNDLKRKIAFLIISENNASLNLVITKLNIGHNTAIKVFKSLEDLGIIGPSNGNKSREILVSYEVAKQILDNE